jgi:predicted heme/steroid binding protein
LFKFQDLSMNRNENADLNKLSFYTRAQLALRNGNDRQEIWCAYEGLIYDVTTSRLWRNGMHYEHWAGQDLTNELKEAPHTSSVFTKFKVVGKLTPVS